MKSSQLVTAIAFALAWGSSASAANLVAKQLAGPPNDFAAMAPVEPGAAAIHSKSALIPVQLEADKSGARVWQGALPTEGGRSRFLVFSGSDASWSVQMQSADGGAPISAKALARSARRAEFGIEQASYPADYYALDQLGRGEWKLNLRADPSSPGQGFVLIEGDSRTQLASYIAGGKQQVGQRMQIAALLTHDDGSAEGKAGHTAGSVLRASLRVTAPDGAIAEYPMFDDGKHGDGLADDGTYGGSFKGSQAGRYLAQVQVEGLNLDGEKLLRSAEHVVPMVESDLRIAAELASAKSTTPGRLAVSIPVSSSKASGHYRAYAEVWGTGGNGKPLPVAWISGMTEHGSEGLSLGLDQRWLAKAGARAPFELRNVRIEDPDHFVTLASAKRLDLALPALNIKAAPGLAVDEAMTMGPRPASLAAKGVGTRLLLVHGYCSGGVWPAAQFSNASSFLDANQNRSHDQFARLIQSYGSTWNSFGVVAHSQGGAASLHLYTYYWSGLDYATGSRLIQSVGTPYQGTNLAGVLAALGGIFGVGCGMNDNLTYSGAASWLAGIPTSARAKVNYYTTAFRSTNWWTNDYCNFASDLVLSDPEDGTTERAYGQLSGAVNRGHVTGQCHTAGMRDPAQYLDASRNSTLNANAAR